ncbi:MAG: DNA adenine methylase [Victivallaceae bacterium]|nr:DNA adenine methylase [Victivallaceae bacterium]
MNNAHIRAPFPWFGGKGGSKIKNAILSLLPHHAQYVEPFGGGGNILIAKEPSKVEVYNDVNRGIVNFFRVIADVEYFGKFMARASLLPVSRELYEEYMRTWPAIHDPVEQAVQWYYIIQQSFGATFGSSWGTSVFSSNRGMAQTTSRWRASFENLPKVHDRIQRVQIECADWRDILKRYCGPGWLAYCDPPYVIGTRKAGGYEHELKDEDHEELIETLLNYDGAVLLSGYDNPLYKPLEKAGWEKHEIEVVCSAAGRTRVSGLQGEGNAKAKQKRIECIWRNPIARR